MYEKQVFNNGSFFDNYSPENSEINSYTFIVNTNSKTYHLYECSAAKKIKSTNKLTITKTAKTKDEARQQIENDGYHVCGICLG